MFLSADVISLVLYCLQQVGIMLGVGAETIILVAYVISLKDGVVDQKETQFALAIKRALVIGLTTIMLSGIAIVAFHVMQGNELIWEPAFLFKWFLILLVFGAALFGTQRVLSQPLWEGAVGGTWYALFLVHILAPITSWLILFEIYAFWVAGFMMIWGSIILSTRGGHAALVRFKKEKPVAEIPNLPILEKVVEPEPFVPPPKPFVPPPQPKPVVAAVIAKPTPPPAPQARVIPPAPRPPAVPTPVVAAVVPPAQPKPVIQPLQVPQRPIDHNMELAPISLVHASALPMKASDMLAKPPIPPEMPLPHKPAMEIPQKAIEEIDQQIVDPDASPALPAIRVMPRTPEDLATQNRASIVQFT